MREIVGVLEGVRDGEDVRVGVPDEVAVRDLL